LNSQPQRGVALIIALLVVAIVTLVAVTMANRQQLDIRRTANLLHYEQAYLYALGAESWVRRILRDDDKTFDGLTDVWAMQLPSLPIPGGRLQGRVLDLQGRFNLNNLILSDKPEADFLFFENLLTVLELPTSLADVIVDWIDNDETARAPEGAEDNVYLIKTPAYRAANTLLSDPSEIRLLAGFEEAATYEKLLPYVSTLPTYTPLNINTASLPLLVALGLDAAKAETLIHQVQQKPFQSLQDFLTHDLFANVTVNAHLITVASHYFLLTTHVQIERGKAHLNSLLHRTLETTEVLMRSQSVLALHD
jgi:general secretion pathway protein K